jgi:hypothetical protein
MLIINGSGNQVKLSSSNNMFNYTDNGYSNKVVTNEVNQMVSISMNTGNSMSIQINNYNDSDDSGESGLSDESSYSSEGSYESDESDESERSQDEHRDDIVNNLTEYHYCDIKDYFNDE